jgi:hypothetical protein
VLQAYSFSSTSVRPRFAAFRRRLAHDVVDRGAVRLLISSRQKSKIRMRSVLNVPRELERALEQLVLLRDT